MSFTEALVPLIFLLCLFGGVVWVTAVRGRSERARIAAREALQARMLEKFGSSSELISFLQTEGGREFVGTPAAVESSPLQKVLSHVRKGVILVIVGLAVLLISEIYFDREESLAMLGIVLAALGAGFLVSSAISYRLAKSWGLISIDPRPQQTA